MKAVKRMYLERGGKAPVMILDDDARLPVDARQAADYPRRGTECGVGNEMTPRRRTVRLVAICLGAALLSGPVAARSIVDMMRRSGLTQEDVNIMTRSGATLYSGRSAVVGNDAIWSNPATRSHGMVEVTGVDGQCVTLRHSFRARGQQRTQELATRRCLTNGTWQLSAP